MLNIHRDRCTKKAKSGEKEDGREASENTHTRRFHLRRIGLTKQASGLTSNGGVYHR